LSSSSSSSSGGGGGGGGGGGDSSSSGGIGSCSSCEKLLKEELPVEKFSIWFPYWCVLFETVVL
jgi:hypothetical protein